MSENNKTCKHCGEPVSPKSTVFCEEHLIKNRERGVKDRQRRKEAGLCRSCNEPLSPKSITWCEEHRLRQNELSRLHSKKQRENQLCIDCDAKPRMERKQRCESCQNKYETLKSVTCRRVGCDERIGAGLKYFCRPHADEENEKLKQRRQTLKKQHKCIFCFTTMEDGSHILCVDCRNKQKEQRRSAATA
jgi:hypothetical protein